MREQVSIVVATLLAFACKDAPPERPDSAATAIPATQVSTKAPFRVPQESEIKDSVTLASVRRGRALIHSTKDSLPAYVGASLTCANCHISDGTVADAMPLVGSYARF